MDGGDSDGPERQLIAAARRDVRGEPIGEPSPGETEDVPSPVSRPPCDLPADALTGYTIVREIRRGGQAVVYQAIQESTKRKVAIKVMSKGPFAGPAEKARFEREVQILGQLQHPNIVAIHDTGVVAGTHYIVMDYIKGKRLTEYLEEKQLSPRGVLRLFKSICAAVAYAHQHGVIHRDLKPGNILVDANGEPHVLDFGLAKLAGPDMTATGQPVSMTGDFIGTLAYAAPEQTRGDPSQIDIRTDAYALGVILYEMLTGHYPYPVVGQIAEVLDNILARAPDPPSSWHRASRQQRRDRKTGRPYKVDHELDSIVLKALSKDQSRRYQSAEHLGRDIERYLLGEPIEAKQDSVWYVLRKTASRHVYATTVAASILVIICSSLVICFNAYLGKRSALAARETAFTTLAARNKAIEQIRAGTHPAAFVRTMSALFAGYREDMPPGLWEGCESVPFVVNVMGFMHDDAYSPDQLLADLGADHEALAYLAIGERHLKAGRRDGAIDAFEAAVLARGTPWAKGVSRARLKELRSAKIDVHPSGGLDDERGE